jgi:hypothetical protein
VEVYLNLCSVIRQSLDKYILDAQMTCRNFQVLRVLESTLRLKAEADSSSRGQKDFICREEKRKAAWGHAAGPGNQWSHGSGWKLSFYSLFFFIARRQRCLSGANRCFLGRRSVSLANYHLLGPPEVCPSRNTGDRAMSKRASSLTSRAYGSLHFSII